MKHIGIRYNSDKVDRARVDEFSNWLRTGGRKVTVIGRAAKKFPRGMDMLIVMGGDGTLLGGARAAVSEGVPVLGIDFGGLGFLSEIKYPEARAAMKKILRGEFRLDERLVLQADVSRHTGARETMRAVNDAVIIRKSGRMLRLKVFINGKYFHEFPGDGLIVSTSTGSTAYALSAGGPIVSPELDVIVLTPICPHTLFARAIIVSGEDTVRIEMPPGRDDPVLILDGQEEFHLASGDIITMHGAPVRAKYVRVSEPHFFETVREKFNLT